MDFMSLFTLPKKKNFKYKFYFLFSFFFLIHIIFFLFINRKKIFKNQNILIFHSHAFGHQVLMADYLIRYYLKKKQTFLAIQVSGTVRTNQKHYLLYKNYFETLVLKNTNSVNLAKVYSTLLKKIFLIISNFKKINLIDYDKFNNDNFNKYRVKKKVLFFDENKNKILEHTSHQYWIDEFDKYYPKLKHDLDKNIIEKCEIFLNKKNVNTGRKIVNIFFREVNGGYPIKNKNKLFYFDRVRTTYKAKNYIKTIKWLEQNNYNIFIHTLDTETTNTLKSYKLKNTYFVNSFSPEIDIKILSLYLYVKSSLHICQNSGSHLLAHILDTRIIMLDHYPITEGCPKGEILCPAILNENTVMKFKDYNQTDFLYGKGIDFRKIKILPNTEDEIYQIVSKNFTNVRKVNELIPENCLSKYRSNEIYASF